MSRRPPATNRPDTAEDQDYSPFVILLVVFATLIFLQAYYIVGDIRERSAMSDARSRMAPALAEAIAVNQTTERVGQELLALAGAGSAEAARIVAEFNIRANAPVPTPTNPPPAAAAAPEAEAPTPANASTNPPSARPSAQRRN